MKMRSTRKARPSQVSQHSCRWPWDLASQRMRTTWFKVKSALCEQTFKSSSASLQGFAGICNFVATQLIFSQWVGCSSNFRPGASWRRYIPSIGPGSATFNETPAANHKRRLQTTSALSLRSMGLLLGQKRCFSSIPSGPLKALRYMPSHEAGSDNEFLTHMKTQVSSDGYLARGKQLAGGSP